MANGIPSTDDILAMEVDGEAPPSTDEVLAMEIEGEPAATPPSPSVDDVLAMEVTSEEAPPDAPPTDEILALEVEPPPEPKTRSEKLARAEEERKEILRAIEKNEKIEEQVKKMMATGASQEQIEAYKEAQGYDEGSWWKGFAESLPRLSQTESSYPIDVERAKAGEKENFSPLMLLGTAAQDVVQAWKGRRLPDVANWRAMDKDVRKRVKEELQTPIVDKDGIINFDALQKSNLSRKDQNDIALDYAVAKTGIRRELWEGILKARFGLTPKDGLIATTGKRIAQVADSVAANIPSWARARGFGVGDSPVSKVKALKAMEPIIPIELQKGEDGKVYTNNGLLVEDAGADDSEAELRKKAWATIVDEMIGTVEDQALENWAQLGDAVLAATGVGAVKGAASGLAKAAVKAPALAKAARGTAKLAKAGEVATGRIGESVLRLAGQSKRLDKAAEKGSKALKVFRAIDRTASPVASNAALNAIGAAEGRGAEAAVGGFLLGAGMKAASLPFSRLLDDTPPALQQWAREKKALKEVMRTPQYEKLSRFTKRFFDKQSGGLSYPEFRAMAEDFQQVGERSAQAYQRLVSGASTMDDAAIHALVDNIANDPQAQDFLNHLTKLSNPGRPLTAHGWSREAEVLKPLLEAGDEFLAAKRQEINAGASATANADPIERLTAMNRRFKEAVRTVPVEVLNGPLPEFQAYLRGVGSRLKYMSKEIDDIIEGAKKVDPYRRVAQDILKLVVAAEEARTPVDFHKFVDYITNAPALAKEFEKAYDRSRQVTRLDPFTGKPLERISEEATARALQENPQAIKETLALSQDTVKTFYALKAEDRRLASLPQQMAEKKREFQEAVRRRRIETSLDREYLERQVTLAEAEAQRRFARANNGWVDKEGRTYEGIGRQLFNASRQLSPKEAKPVLAAIGKLQQLERLSEADLRALPNDEVRALALRGDRDIRAGYKALDRISDVKRSLGTLDERLKESLSLRKEFTTKELYKAATKDELAVVLQMLGELPGLGAEVKGSPYVQNVLVAIAKDLVASAEDGSFVVAPRHLSLLRLLENTDLQEKLLGKKLKAKDQAKITSGVRHLADTLHEVSKDAEHFRLEVESLRELMKTQPENVGAVARQISFLRDAFHVSKLSREVQTRSAQLYAIAEKLSAGKKLSTKDTRALVWFAKSTMMERMQMAKNPHWIVTYQKEVDTIFRAMKEIPETLYNRGVELTSRSLGLDPETLDAAVITGWFIHPKSGYDGMGRFKYALAAAEYWHEAGKYLEETSLRHHTVPFWSQEFMATVLSRDTALSVQKDTQLLGTQKRRAVMLAQEKFFKGYSLELESLSQNGKPYSYYQSRDGFVSLWKRIQGGVHGFTKNHFFVVNGEVTRTGKLALEWARRGFTEKAMDEIVAEEKGRLLRPGMDARALRALDREMEDLKNDFLSYLPKPTDSKLSGNLRDVTADDYEMLMKVQAVHQKWDKKKVELRNELQHIENKRSGTRFHDLEYFPYRIDSGSQMLQKLSDKPEQLDSPHMYSMLFGRNISSSIEGQIAKAQGVLDEKNLMHPQEAALRDAQQLFQAVLTREPARRLQDVARTFRDAGYENVARAVLGHLLLADLDAQAARQGGIGRGLQTLLDRAPLIKEARVLGPYMDPAVRLATPVKTMLENPLQTGLMGMATNPKTALRELKALAFFLPEFVNGATHRILALRRKGQDADPTDVKLLFKGFTPLTPEYLKELAALSQSLNPEKDAKAEQLLKRVNWNASPAFKRMDIAAGDKAHAYSTWLQSLFKENSEKLGVDMRLEAAGSLWKAVNDALYDLKKAGAERPELIKKAYEMLGNEFRGALEDRSMAYHFAVDAADGVLNGTPLSGLRGFATAYANQQIGRFDPDNVPQALKALARWRPGASQFYNSTTNGIYRLLLGAHAMFGRRGASAAQVSTATASVAAFLGMASAAAYATYVYGVPWFGRLSPVSGVETGATLVSDDKSGSQRVAAALQTALLDPAGSRGGGDMVTRTTLSLIGMALAYSVGELTAEEDGTTDTAAFERGQRDLMAKMLDVAYMSQPVALFTDTFLHVPRWGYSWFAADGSEFYDALARAHDEGLVTPYAPGELAPGMESPGVDAMKAMTNLAHTMAKSIVPLRHVEEMDEKYLAAVYSELGVNVPGSVLAKIVKTIHERKAKQEARGASVQEGMPVE